MNRKSKIIAFELSVIIILFISNYFALFHNDLYFNVLDKSINWIKQISVNVYNEIMRFVNWISSQQYDWKFSNREIAIGSIVLIIVFWFVIDKKRRKILFDLFRILFNKRFVRIYFEIFIYTVMMTSILYKIRFWEFDLTKDTLFWMFFTSLYFAYKSYEKRADEKLFYILIKDVLKLTIVFEFIINFYTFPIVIEIIGIVILVLIGAMIGITDFEKNRDDKNYKILKKFFERTLSVIGLFIIIYVIRSMIINLGELFTLDHFKELLLPIILSLAFIPFIYFLLIRICYSEIISYVNANKNLRFSDKLRFMGLVVKKNKFNRMSLVMLMDKHSGKIRNFKSISTLVETILI